MIEFLGAIGLLFYATRLEHYREAHETPLIIRAWAEPEKPKRHWFWIKLAIASASFSVIAAIAVFAWTGYAHRNSHSVTAEVKAPTATKPAAPVNPIPKHTSSPARVLPPHTEKTTEKPSTKTAKVVIPIPDRPAPPKPAGNNGASRPTATIGGKEVRASDKVPGTLYASIKLADFNQYRGTLDNKSVDAVKTALEATGKITVFLGTFEVGTTTGVRSYGIGGLGAAKARSVNYFDKSLESACDAVQMIIEGVIGTPMHCVFLDVGPAPSDPNEVNFQRDFWVASGLDMEITL